jgi:hypothetical protein
MSGLRKYSPNRYSIHPHESENDCARESWGGGGHLENAERQTDWTLIVQDRVTERIMGESHSVWLAIYWSARLSS